MPKFLSLLPLANDPGESRTRDLRIKRSGSPSAIIGSIEAHTAASVGPKGSDQTHSAHSPMQLGSLSGHPTNVFARLLERLCAAGYREWE